MYAFSKFVKNNIASLLFLASAPALASTADAKSALCMGAVVCAVVILSNSIMALVGKAVTDGVRLPLAIVISAGLSSMAQMLLAAYLPSVYSMLGIYVAVVAVNAMVVYMEASEASPARGLLTGMVFLAVVSAMGMVRELLGQGTFFGSEVGFFRDHTIAIFARPSGAFILFAIALAAVSCIGRKEA